MILYCAVKIILYTSAGSVFAAEKLIQNEEMSFEVCLKVIQDSTEKLLVNPQISDGENGERIAIFKLQDGKLKITCDGLNKLLTVSSFWSSFSASKTESSNVKRLICPSKLWKKILKIIAYKRGAILKWNLEID